ncbi:MAG: Hsp70 family protein [Candidatus Contendobacter sp.]|nr:Hsp70 family protein [Candidatus Contendobacter sp.]
MNTLALITPPGIQLRIPTQPLRVIGIDLGTTNSTIAEILWTPGDADAPKVRCLEVEQPTQAGLYTHTLVPSVVALHGGQQYVGEGAKTLRARVADFKLELYKNIFWDCKNHMGIRRTYHKAPAGFQSAKAIAGHVLHFLKTAAETENETPITRAVVTVPASFQAAQRQDTVDAAALAGLELAEGELLDEPIAAFLDYLCSHDPEAFGDLTEPRHLLVFDFGGGTCDVAIFHIEPRLLRDPFKTKKLAVSRYHRLGGGDIDRAIAVEVLIPQLLEQNGLKPNALDFTAKDKFVIPALLGVAEALKIGLCREIARLKKFGHYEERRETLVKKNPGVYDCTLPDKTALRLQSPTLSAVQFDELLEPFLDRDLLYARETEYRMTCSIFAPLVDALDRAGLSQEDIDLCLLVGGSSLIPQVIDAITEDFPTARILQFADSDATQTAVARGAAWQALALALYDQGVIQPVTSDSLAIQTHSGPVELIPSGVALPYPPDGGWAENHRLVVPHTSIDRIIPLRVEVRDSSERVLMRRIWEIKAPVIQGSPLLLRYRMDANQVLHVRLSLPHDPQQEFQDKIENPLTHVVNPNATREKIDDLEEQMRTKAIPAAQQPAMVQQIALLYADLGQRERAIDLLASLLRSGPDLNILNRMGIISGEMGDTERQEKYYREAARISNSGIPLFNLALAQHRQGKREAAVQTIDQAIARDHDPPYLVLKAQIADALRQSELRDTLLEEAFATFDPITTLDDWELGWYLTGAQLDKNTQRQQEAETERHRRRNKGQPISDDSTLPDARTVPTRHSP